MKKIITKTEEETINFAKNLAESFNGGEILCLEGDLGAGKTIFSKGVAKGLRYAKNVNSPTFVVMKVYNIKNNKKGIKNLVHIDAYRLQSAEDIETIGGTEYFDKKNTITIIEWPKNIIDAIPKLAIWIKIKNVSEKEREITVL